MWPATCRMRWSTSTVWHPASKQTNDKRDPTLYGVTYVMRFVTVTADDNHALGQTSHIDLSEEMNADSILDILDEPISIFTPINILFNLGTLYTILDFFPDVVPTTYDSIDYRGSTNWTVTYAQIYDTATNSWHFHSSTERVTMDYYVVYTSYSSVLDRYTHHSDGGIYGYVSSDYCDDTAWLKEYAVKGYLGQCLWQDTVDEVQYQFGGTTVLTHQRFTEPLGYEP